MVAFGPEHAFEMKEASLNWQTLALLARRVKWEVADKLLVAGRDDGCIGFLIARKYILVSKGRLKNFIRELLGSQSSSSKISDCDCRSGKKREVRRMFGEVNERVREKGRM